MKLFLYYCAIFNTENIIEGNFYDLQIFIGKNVITAFQIRSIDICLYVSQIYLF